MTLRDRRTLMHSVLVGLATAAGCHQPTDQGSSPIQHIKTVFVIVMENHNWADIVGSPSAPYINGTLLPMAAHAEAYYDNPDSIHPSEPNYIWMEAGSNLGITDDADPAAHPLTTTDHLVTQLEVAGLDWRSYQEDMPPGCPVISTGLYAAKHNPMVFFTDVAGDPPSPSTAGCIQHVRPYTELATDLQGQHVAAYNFIVPNLCNDMHNLSGCGSGDAVSHGDTWLSQAVPQILASAAYKDGGALFITWDESSGGEHPIGMIVLSPLAKQGYAGTVRYYHSSLLRTVEDIFGLPYLRDAANQESLSDLFQQFP
jgi:phospholipase C